MTQLFDLPANPSVPVICETDAFPVRSIFCVGRIYSAHAKEMGF
jgi:fumarylpyruvate hydrolase